jgi:hypothetical protein
MAASGKEKFSILIRIVVCSLRTDKCLDPVVTELPDMMLKSETQPLTAREINSFDKIQRI